MTRPLPFAAGAAFGQFLPGEFKRILPWQDAERRPIKASVFKRKGRTKYRVKYREGYNRKLCLAA